MKSKSKRPPTPQKKPAGTAAAARAAAWLDAPAREEHEQGERKARRLARAQAERETFGPGGRPRAVSVEAREQELAEGEGA
jgi:hypothetical protein